MFHFRAIKSAHTALKALAPVAAFAGAIALASPSQATQYFLQSATMDTSRPGTITGPGMSNNTYLGPIQFTAFEGASAVGGSFNLLAFCVDIFHHINLGQVNLKYDDNFDLTTNSKYTTTTPFAGATALTTDQVTQVGRLVNYGTLLFNQAPSSTDRTNKLAGLQGAIWQVINPGYSVTSGNAAVTSYIGAYSGNNYLSNLTGYGPVSSNITFISETGKYGTKSAHQSFAFAAVPEPSMWIMMIAGFGLSGAMLRRARPKLVVARV